MTVLTCDVARGFSLLITSVSQAIDGYPGMAGATRQEVVRVANELGYVLNRAACQFHSQRADAIGYVFVIRAYTGR
jgi:DNA-binding LacI/PurR family transcriptional regulator